jgi:hypothetical protein
MPAFRSLKAASRKFHQLNGGMYLSFSIALVRACGLVVSATTEDPEDAEFEFQCRRHTNRHTQHPRTIISIACRYPRSINSLHRPCEVKKVSIPSVRSQKPLCACVE